MKLRRPSVTNPTVFIQESTIGSSNGNSIPPSIQILLKPVVEVDMSDIANQLFWIAPGFTLFVVAWVRFNNPPTNTLFPQPPRSCFGEFWTEKIFHNWGSFTLRF